MGKKTFATAWDDSEQANQITSLISTLGAISTALAPLITIASSGNTFLMSRVSSLSGAAGI